MCFRFVLTNSTNYSIQEVRLTETHQLCPWFFTTSSSTFTHFPFSCVLSNFHSQYLTLVIFNLNAVNLLAGCWSGDQSLYITPANPTRTSSSPALSDFSLVQLSSPSSLHAGLSCSWHHHLQFNRQHSTFSGLLVGGLPPFIVLPVNSIPFSSYSAMIPSLVLFPISSPLSF